MNERSQMDRSSWVKYITPVLVTVAIFLLGNLTLQIGRVDDKLFHHLANDEIHMPRSQFVSKAEFEIQSRFIEKENDRIIRAIDELRNELRAQYSFDRKK